MTPRRWAPHGENLCSAMTAQRTIIGEKREERKPRGVLALEYAYGILGFTISCNCTAEYSEGYKSYAQHNLQT